MIAPAQMQSTIAELAPELTDLDNFEAVVELLSIELATDPTYSGPASTYDLYAQYEQDAESAVLVTAGEPLSAQRNSATWGPLDDPDTPGLGESEIFASLEPAPIVGQIIYEPATETVISVDSSTFVESIKPLTTEAIVVETTSTNLLTKCADERLDGSSNRRPAKEVITGHEMVPIEDGWQLKVTVDFPADFSNDGVFFRLVFLPKVAFTYFLGVDPATFTVIVPNEITFDAVLTQAEAEYFDGLLAALP